MILNRAGIFEFVLQLRKIVYDGIQIPSCIIIAIGMQYPYAQPYTPIATRKSPGIAMWCEGATHNQEEFILRVVRSIQVILCSIAVAMKRLPHSCTHSYMTRETTGVNGDGS